MWKGKLILGEQAIAVKMYAAVQDRKIHFRLLHAKDLQPVEQRIVRKSDGKVVPKEERLKAFQLNDEVAVILKPGDLDALEPKVSRDIGLCRFVPSDALTDPWYDRPYYLGPDGDGDDYFALVAALEQQKVVGIARWSMRKQRYIGALMPACGYLMLVTLRRAEQVLSVSNVEAPAGGRAGEKELRLAKQLVETIAGEFDPKAWQDEYRKRVRAMIAAKAKGEKPKVVRMPPRRAAGGLADQLRQSLASMKERKVA
jgi:DNA end-binding protein Ku